VPTIGIEISGDRVTVVRLGTESPSVVRGVAVEPLPPGAVVPALNAPNIADAAAVTAAIRRALAAVDGKARQVALVLPDPVAKVSLLRFEKVPSRAADLLELIRWQVRKSTPFRIEDAQLTYFAGATSPEGASEFVVTLARRDIVQEYEGACQQAGVHAGVVDTATLNLANAVLAAGAPDTDWLLVNLAADYQTLAILRGAHLIFVRHRGADGEGSLADVVHQTTMYYEDRLQGRGFARVVLAGAGRGFTAEGAEADAVRRQLELRLQTRVDVIDPRPAIALSDRITASPVLLDTLAPAVGLLLRERTA
jgi:Tfp pilus assembly PilM family ATPase